MRDRGETPARRSSRAQAVILLPDGDGRVRHPRGESTNGSLHGADSRLAQWVLRPRRAGGSRHRHAARAQAHYSCRSPARTGRDRRARAAAGESAARLRSRAAPAARDLREPDRARDRARATRRRRRKRSELRAESERLRNALLSAISHDLRTPLASIVGASSSLAERGERMSDAARAELAQGDRRRKRSAWRASSTTCSTWRGCRRAPRSAATGEWHPLEEDRRRDARAARAPSSPGIACTTHIPSDAAGWSNVDAVLIEQVLAQPARERRQVHACRHEHHISRRIRGATSSSSRSPTTGPGLPPGEEERDLRQVPPRRARGARRAASGSASRSARRSCEAHGGAIAAENMPAGGACSASRCRSGRAAARHRREPE